MNKRYLTSNPPLNSIVYYTNYLDQIILSKIAYYEPPYGVVVRSFEQNILHYTLTSRLFTF